MVPSHFFYLFISFLFVLFIYSYLYLSLWLLFLLCLFLSISLFIFIVCVNYLIPLAICLLSFVVEKRFFFRNKIRRTKKTGNSTTWQPLLDTDQKLAFICLTFICLFRLIPSPPFLLSVLRVFSCHLFIVSRL